ncbi:MAG: hypothetical protein AB7I48_24910 [Planctomycetaceae bacterium]
MRVGGAALASRRPLAWFDAAVSHRSLYFAAFANDRAGQAA